MADLYAGAGYGFMFVTDHWIYPETEKRKTAPYPLDVYNGVELDAYDAKRSIYHVLGLGITAQVNREDGLERTMSNIKEQGGILILAHPYFHSNTLEEALRYDFHGVEAYNNVCQSQNGKGCGTVHWDAMLEHNPAALGTASDDAHLDPEFPVWDGGWVVVNSGAGGTSILSQIKSGNFYSSRGPEIHSITESGGTIRVETSPVRFICVVGPVWDGKTIGSGTGDPIEGASFKVPNDWAYARLEIEDDTGKCAWSNALFV